MKKFYLLASALVALSASAQYTTATPYADESVVAGETQIFDVLVAPEEVLSALQQNGQKVNDIRVNDETRNLYIWTGGETFAAGDGSGAGVGYNGPIPGGDYVSLNVADQGWSGAGFNISEDAKFNNKHWNDNTRVHLSLMSNSGTSPISVAFIFADGDIEGSAPAKTSVGESPFVDNGASYPLIAPRLTDEWMGVDISFADLKKLWNTFNYVGSDNWAGNIVSFLGGGVQGQNISLDLIYFHTPASGDNAVKGVEDDAQFVVTSNTVNAVNAKSIELYDLSGRLIKSVNGTTLGISDLGSGIYVAKAGNAVKKIMK